MRLGFETENSWLLSMLFEVEVMLPSVLFGLKLNAAEMLSMLLFQTFLRIYRLMQVSMRKFKLEADLSLRVIDAVWT
jgi:hypothetical protein